MQPNEQTSTAKLEFIKAEDRDGFSKLYDNIVVLDGEKLTSLYQEAFSQDPGAAHKLFPKCMRMTERLAWRFARRVASALGRAPAVIAQALYVFIWAELSTLLPVRHLVRSMRAKGQNQVFLIPVPSKVEKSFIEWGENPFEPFYLYQCLRHLGLPTFLLATDSPRRSSFLSRLLGGGEEEPLLSIRINDIWNKSSYLRVLYHQRAAIYPLAIRGVPVLSKVTGIPFVRPGSLKLAAKRQPVFPPRKFNGKHLISLSKGECLGEGVQPWATELSIFTLIEQTIFQVMTLASTQIDRGVAQHKSNHAHVCDCLHMQDAFLADSVRKRGGRVTTWPHSANAAMPKMLAQTQDYETIYCASKFARRQFASVMPDQSYKIIPEEMFQPRPISISEWLPGKPINVVIIGNANSLSRIPMLNLDAHNQTYRRMLSALFAVGQDIRVHVKPKDFWETAEWVSALAPQGMTVHPVDVSLPYFNLPNMVFLTVNNPSTAIFEGINWGIPSLIVKETDVHTYVSQIPADIVPQSDAFDIAKQVTALQDPEVRHQFIDRQRAWLSQEILGD